MNPGAETVTRRRPGPVDDYGDPGPVAELVIQGCSVQPRSSSETNELSTTVVTGLALWAPAGTDLAPEDRVVWRGVEYGIDGDPGVWVDLDGAEDHVYAALRRVTG